LLDIKKDLEIKFRGREQRRLSATLPKSLRWIEHEGQFTVVDATLVVSELEVARRAV
jgi:hypothetical protein